MKYVFDTNTLSNIFNHYYFDSFPTFWKRFNKLILISEVISVREVRKEIEEKGWDNNINEWVKTHKDFFEKPTIEELEFITQIYTIKHFQQNLERKKLQKGGSFDDPFIIAKAKIINGTVVTHEKYKPNAAKIPNICKHFNIKCIDLEGFLIEKDWEF